SRRPPYLTLLSEDAPASCTQLLTISPSKCCKSCMTPLNTPAICTSAGKPASQILPLRLSSSVLGEAVTASQPLPQSFLKSSGRSESVVLRANGDLVFTTFVTIPSSGLSRVN